MCLFEILTTLVCCLATVLYNCSANRDKGVRARHKETRGWTPGKWSQSHTGFYKKGHRLANRNIRWFIFEFENLHTLKIDDYEIQIKQFNSGCQAPRNHIRQLQKDEKHRQWKWVEGCVEKIKKIGHLKWALCNFPFSGPKIVSLFGNFCYRIPFFFILCLRVIYT